MSYVLVLDTEKRPLDPCSSARARLLLRRGKAALWRAHPFTIILKHPVHSPHTQPLRLKLDPGSKTTGVAVLNDASGQVIFAAELTHRGEQVREALSKRRAARRNRRHRKTRYRQPRWANRRRRAGWMSPSLLSRMANITTWVQRLCRISPITAISVELARFDTQLLQNPEIAGREYQRGTLVGTELRQYLLARWEHRCAYCEVGGVPLELEHLVPKSNGGSDRVANLVMACHRCNQEKGDRPLEQFLASKPEVLARIQAQQQAPLRDAAAVNTLRWALYERLQATGLPVEVGSGGQTKWNRTRLGLPKTHFLDAACVGASTPEVLRVEGIRPVRITATGRGSRQQCRMTRYGFVRTQAKQARTVQGFRTGDLVRAIVSTGKKAGTYRGRVAVRSTGSFNITTASGTVQGIHARYCTLIQRADGYQYTKGAAALLPIP
jgi:hypothetical protein